MTRVFNPFSRSSAWQVLGIAAALCGYVACTSDKQASKSEHEGAGSEASDGGKAGTANESGAAGKAIAGEGGSPAPSAGEHVAGAAGDAAEPQPEPDFFGLGSVVINAEGDRTTYLQTIKSLEDGPFDNERAIEMPGNGVFLASGANVFAGLAEEPSWVRYTANAAGVLKDTGRLSLLAYGISGIDYGNAIVNDELAVSVLSGPAVAVVWNTKTLEIEREIDLKHLVVAGYSLEVWTTEAHGGLVYVPGRWADWEAGKIRNGVSMTIIDPVKGTIVGVAADDRCASGGRAVFDEAGYAYVMGDGRNYSIQMYANAGNKPAPKNCLLRIAPGKTDFDADFFYEIPSLTGGLESITEIETGLQGSGLAFSKMFDPSKLPADIKPVDFTFWDHPAHKMWRIELADPPVAKMVDGMPYSAIGFGGNSFRGKLYTGESVDQGATSDVYEVDATKNAGALRFEMDGYFYGLYEVSVK